jgi:DNA-binding protein H-NS
MYDVKTFSTLPFPRRIAMAKTSRLASMSVEALLKLRQDIGRALAQKANQLQDQLSRLGAETGAPSRRHRSSLRGRKVPIKYRDKAGNTWAGRGAQPVWLREKIKGGAKLEDFAVHKSGTSRKAARKKSKKPRKAKRRMRSPGRVKRISAETTA